MAEDVFDVGRQASNDVGVASPGPKRRRRLTILAIVRGLRSRLRRWSKRFNGRKQTGIPKGVAVNLALRELARTEAQSGPGAALEYARSLARNYPSNDRVLARIAPLEVQVEGRVSPHVREQLLKRLAGSTRPMAVARAAVP